MKKIAKATIPELLHELKKKYEVYAPIKAEGGTRIFSKFDFAALALEGGQLPMSPAFIFFPLSEELFSFDRQNIEPAIARREKPVLVFGLSAADAAGLAYMDTFFRDEYLDNLYFARRERSIIITYAGETGSECFEPLAKNGYDVQFAAYGDEAFIYCGSDAGVDLINQYASFFEKVEDEHSVQKLLEEKKLQVDSKEEIDRASVLLRAGKVDDDFWEWMSMRCISCGSCRQVCPTCTCFDVWDRSKEGKGARFRSWDPCILEGFTREASGHNPRGEIARRYRRIIEHKLRWDPERWGVLGCVKCGRCDDVCPVDIGIHSAAKEIIKRYGKKNA